MLGMRDRPQDFDEAMLRPALKAWGVDAATLEYAPVGFGDYHWVADGRGGRWFVTVVDVRRRAKMVRCVSGGEYEERHMRGRVRFFRVLSAVSSAWSRKLPHELSSLAVDSGFVCINRGRQASPDGT